MEVEERAARPQRDEPRRRDRHDGDRHAAETALFARGLTQPLAGPDALQVEPSACVYLDDLGINLKPAREMGMRTIKVVDPDVAIDELQAMVGIPLRG